MSGNFPRNIDDAVPKFMYEILLPAIVSEEAGTKVNIHRAFGEFLRDEGVPASLLEEKRDRWMPNLKQRLFLLQLEWISLGIPSPFEATDRSETYVTWKHANYESITGRMPISRNFASIYQWLSEQSDRELLFVCACYLKLIGASVVFVTDKPGDGGIDVIGKAGTGPLQSSCFFVQAKSSKAVITREVVLTEFGKFLACKSTDMFSLYRDALGMRRSTDGSLMNFIFITNSEFHESARIVATDLGILLRSRRQLAHWFAQHITSDQLKNAREAISNDLKADLCKNLLDDMGKVFTA